MGGLQDFRGDESCAPVGTGWCYEDWRGCTQPPWALESLLKTLGSFVIFGKTIRSILGPFKSTCSMGRLPIPLKCPCCNNPVETHRWSNPWVLNQQILLVPCVRNQFLYLLFLFQRISLVSSFAASLFLGSYASIDYSDGKCLHGFFF